MAAAQGRSGSPGCSQGAPTPTPQKLRLPGPLKGPALCEGPGGGGRVSSAADVGGRGSLDRHCLSPSTRWGREVLSPLSLSGVGWWNNIFTQMWGQAHILEQMTWL